MTELAQIYLGSYEVSLKTNRKEISKSQYPSSYKWASNHHAGPVGDTVLVNLIVLEVRRG